MQTDCKQTLAYAEECTDQADFQIHVVNEQHMMTNTVHCDMRFPPVAGGSEPSEDHEDCRCALEGPRSSKLLELPDDAASALT